MLAAPNEKDSSFFDAWINEMKQLYFLKKFRDHDKLAFGINK